MTRADLIEAVFRKIEPTPKEAALIVETILASMTRALRAGEKVELRGFGSFRTRARRGRIARNPKTGARVKVEAKRIPFFKPSRDILAILNPSRQSGADPP